MNYLVYSTYFAVSDTAGSNSPPPFPGLISNNQLWLTIFGGYEQCTIDSMVYCLGNIRFHYAERGSPQTVYAWVN